MDVLTETLPSGASPLPHLLPGYAIMAALPASE